MRKARVRFSRSTLENIEETVRAGLIAQRDLFAGRRSIAIAAGSRGIANIQRIIKAAVEAVRELGAEPFVFPAMGSHGGATADGQVQLLASYGIEEKEIGCPVRSSMEVIELDATGLRHGLFMDRIASGADGILLVNRIKPHTDFHARFESGLAKMAVIGLGKERQALEMHHFGTYGLRELLPKAAARILAGGKIVAGIGIIENAYDETARVEVIPGSRILEEEPELLEEARANMPRLPIDEIDILIVDELGKNVSGTGMDTNIIGRIRIPSEPEPPTPRIKTIIVDDLTAESHGNATGMGLADVVTQKFFEKIDFKVTYRNIVTSSFLERGKLPVVADTAAHAFSTALRSCGVIEPGRERVVRIRNTLELGEIYLSEFLAGELSGRDDLGIGAEHVNLLASDGGLQPF